ncbi:membrane alanyl aminopeptidase-like [Maniola jurtina]|uniref:membrane alanyl aminopeptidase-like n=1 Tax=Maniola jurtina TaxID=191418 RepID=UPI001E68B408|nr:membrane alanyl aminopeptidase-like [Maniola jurtina]XP_045765662.1 membrane alanyl aminopeptidase-like [Maniola jurtina]
MLRQLLQLALLCFAIQSVCAETDPKYRLNTTITPSSYSVLITPYFDTGDDRAFTFDGEVQITFTTSTNINTVKIHSENLTYTASNISLTNGVNTISLLESNPLEFEEKYSFAHINFESELSSSVEYILKIVFSGSIREDLAGFYKNYYIEKGVKKWLGATQFESTNARKVFPCFDEPEYKAVFTLTIDRPANYKPTLANTKLQSNVSLSNGYVRETFYPTPKMSTYLVAFLVSEFEAQHYSRNGTKELGVFTRPEAKNQTDYTFDFALRVVQALGDYFGIDYYSTNSNLKLDHIALIDFKAGAMENWGLVTYRESLLLNVPEESTPYYKYRVAQIIAHETTHMWFGNLVTCHWWSNTWLNEGFANYFQDYITAMIEPDVAANDQLVIGSVYSALDADDVPDSPPITNVNVNSPDEISGHFGTITYQKAGSVIRMVHHLIGDNAFKSGLNAYLIANSFQPGYPEQLYTALSQGVNVYNSLASYPGSDITDVMSSWISRAGYPLVHVEVNHDDSSIVLTQKRFYKHSTDKSDEIYKIPITYTLETAFDFTNTKPAFIMANKTYVLPVREIKENHSWPILNIQETGLYRVNYDSHTWHHISDHLKSSRREEIHYINRAKIVNDLFAFLFADEVKFDLLHDVLHFLEEETDYAVWFAAVRGFKKLRSHYLGSDSLTVIDEFILHLMDSSVARLGLEVKSTDDYKTSRNRMQILDLACKLGHQGCISEALALYKEFKNNGKWLDPSIREVVYCTGLRYGNGDDYDFLWNRMSTTNVANEARLIGDILGCTSDETKLNSFLVSMLVEDGPIKTQDLTVPLSGVLSNYSNVHVVLEGLQMNISLWKSIYTSLDSVLSTVASTLRTDDEFNKFESWLNSCTECGEKAVTSAKTALTKAKQLTQWAKDHRSDIWSSLRGGAGMASVSFMLLVAGYTLTIGF